MATAISVREATMADLDGMVDVYLAAFPMDPAWNYVFSKHQKHPEETRKLTRLEFTDNLINKHQSRRFMVAEMPKKKDQGAMVVVAISLWEFADKVEGTSDDWSMVDKVEITGDEAGEGCSKRHGPFEGRLDADPARARAYIAATAQAANMYHDLMYGEHQIRLKLLATRPEYQRQGAASKLLDWGMCLSREKLKVLTVLAGPMGRKLYTKTCFYEQGTVDVQVDGEDEKATFSAMVCNSI